MQAEQIKVATLEVIRTLHLLDLGIRGVALVNSEQIGSAIDTARIWKVRDFNYLEKTLSRQNFPMQDFYQVRDTVNGYYELVGYMESLIDNGDKEEFLRIFGMDPGHHVWLQFKQFSDQVNEFENQISTEANANYLFALKKSYWLQILLFLLTMPTLGYLTYYSNKSFSISEKLRIIEEKHNIKLVQQNVELENLIKEVKHRSEELENANQELVDHNIKLEQFAYIISHNIRAPIARIKGLSTVMDAANSDKEIRNIVNRMTSATTELDRVVNDLGKILEIKNINDDAFSKVDLQEVVEKIKVLFQTDLENSQAVIRYDFTKLKTIYSLPQYIESIFTNLISNSIKYRHAKRHPVIQIKSFENNGYQVEFTDNGLGIDLNKYKGDLFTPYKRFHYHVEGKGLGLYLIKSHLEALQGSMEVESEVNKGTTFKIHLHTPNSQNLI